ncbi:MAG: ABC transporter ATP-binding protein [Candidatus Methanolliviera hydrocarbonicum]|uniref:ABC transporter ATP-binding protein n=1 Tax=Candidatus Methanolliviera hydrocarbonicum TaxID=2491085 RepID=A0A520KXU1_9EURY|nr:MAG: ABC transporter ATP-binding protein [Candidatus Methanolliviera hydrocarbonicum]
MLSLKKVEKTYGLGTIKVHALRGIDLNIEEGEFVSIMGPSGSGKSTLLNMIGCLDRPTAGRIVLDGKDLSKLGDNELAKIRRESIGFIFQQFNLIHTMNALENVALPLYFMGIDTERRMGKAKMLLERVGLEDRVYHRPSELSGGEQQRVAIARSLANDPMIILGDEPTGNVDSTAGAAIMDMLEELNGGGKTIIVVTHDAEIAKSAGRIVKMKDGRILNGDF